METKVNPKAIWVVLLIWKPFTEPYTESPKRMPTALTLSRDVGFLNP